MPRKLVAFAASSSKNSINRHLVAYAASLLADVEIQLLDLNDFELPLFSVDREAELGQPQLAQDFYRLIGDCDALLISLAEHNGNYSVAYKNLFDWVSRIDPKPYQNKPMVLLATSPGGRGGKSVLEIALNGMPRFGGEVMASLSVPNFYDCFDIEQGEVKDSSLREQLEETVAQLFAPGT